MANIHIVIKNIRQIRAAFAKSPQVMARNLNMSIRQAVLMIGRDSRRFTPVDTGRLRASTYERFSNLKGEIGTNTEYDIFVHEGTRYMRGRPYLRKSVEMNQLSVDRLMTEAVQKTLDQVARETG